MDARAAWHANFNEHLPGALATKYGISAGVVTSVGDDNDFMQYWVAARHSADAQKQQLTQFFNTIAGNDESMDIPVPIDWSLPSPAPTQVPPGIEKRVRDLAREIKGSMNYAPADGELLGIEAPKGDGGGGSLEEAGPEIEFATLADFALRAKFRKFGNDGVRFEYRRVGGAQWLPAGVLIVSPGTFTIAPAVAGIGEQVEIRGIYFKGNADVGMFSPTYTPFIAP